MGCFDELNIPYTVPGDYINPDPLPPPDCGDIDTWDRLLAYGDPSLIDLYNELGCPFVKPIRFGLKVASTDLLAITVSGVGNIPFRGTYTIETPTGEVIKNSFSGLYPLPTGVDTLYGQLIDGYLLGVSVFPHTDEVWPGWLYCQIAIARSTTEARSAHHILASGYISNDNPLIWPGSGIKSSLDAVGLPYGVIIPNPAAGAEISFTSSERQIFKVHSFMCTLVTDATVANREVMLQLGWNLRGRANVTQPASTTRTYIFQSMPVVGVLNTEMYIHFPFPQTLPDAETIQTFTAGLQAGDQFSAISIWGEHYVYPPTIV